MRDDYQRLLDIREGIERTERYFGIDAEIVWAAVEKELPKLKSGLAQMIEREKPQSGSERK